MANKSIQTAAAEPAGLREGTARIGAELRGVRERLGWKLSDVAEGLRIRAPYLEAIERGELSALPGAAYQTGFVKTYAQALGLDAEEILRRFRAEGMGVATKAELSFLAPVPDRGVPTGAIVLLGVVLLLIGYGLWYRHTEHERRLAAAVQPVPAELAPLAVPKPAPVVVKPAPAAPATMHAAAPAAPAPTANPAPQTLVMPASVVPPTVAPVAGTTGAGAAGRTITATADSWVQVKDPAGTILFSRVLHAGDSWPVPNIPGLTMTAGNAAATEVATGGKPGTPLGVAGTVVHNYALTPAGVNNPQTPPGAESAPPTTQSSRTP